MTVAVTYEFNYTQSRKLTGFSETQYQLNVSDPDDNNVKNAAIDLANLRINLLGAGVDLVNVRLSDTDVKRDSVILSVGDTQNPGTLSVRPSVLTLLQYGNADQSNACIQVRAQQSPKKWKNIYLSGVPDALINTATKTVDISAVPGWSTAFDNWRNKLTNVGGGNWGFRAKNKAGEGLVAEQAPIQAWVPEAAGPGRAGIVMLTAQANWALNNKIHVYAPTLINRGYRTPAGDWVISGKLVDAVAGTSTYFLKNSEGLNIDNILFNGFAQLIQFGYAAYTKAQIIGYTTRKRGVGSYVQRGRSRRKPQRV